MFQRILSTVVALLAIAAFTLCPSGVYARGSGHGGGGHASRFLGGGAAFHGGGFHGGGTAFHGGAFHEGYRGGFREGYRGGGRYYGRGWGGWGGGYIEPWYGYDYGLGYTGYNYLPDYGADVYYNYNASPSYPTISNDNSGYYYGSYPTYSSMPSADLMTTDMASAGAPPTATSDDKAHVRVIVPENAQVWFNDSPTHQIGQTRDFDSPALTPGQNYSYDVKAEWRDQNGKEKTLTRHVGVRAGAHVTVDFLPSDSTKSSAEQSSSQ